MSQLSLSNLTKQFGELTAVNAVNIDVADDEVVCLLGPSGCGKTTTLRMIAGLENATQGSVKLSGTDVTHIPASGRNVAMAFQFYALYPSLTVGENLVYPLYAEKHDAKTIATKLDNIANVLKISHALDRYPHQLSEGEKQRVAVGRCIIRLPSCFLFDEPLSRLDAQLREEMRTDIKKVLAGLSRPTVIVTHDQLEAMTMGDRIVVMRNGGIEQIGPPQDVFRKPVNTFVAGFIGTPQMNLIDGVVNGNGDALSVLVGDDLIHLNAGQYGVKNGDFVTLGMRPRSAQLKSEGGAGIFSGVCDMIEPMGAETLVRISHPAGKLRAVITDRTSVAENQTIHVAFDKDSYSVFDSDGERLGG